jgi:hypothetical protein
MLGFKVWLKECILNEAKIEHFSHIGLDPNNQEHKDLVTAFNNTPQKDLVKKNPNQYKSIDELRTHPSIKHELDKIYTKRIERSKDLKAAERGDYRLIHHDPKSGLKVFKVHNQEGCAAVGDGAKWCTAQRGGNAMGMYDPSGKHSYVIHTPEKGNLSRIGIIGVKPGEKHQEGMGGNFQDKGNNTVSDEDWNMLRKKYKLDDVRGLEGIRGITLGKERKKELSDELHGKIQKGKFDHHDIEHAIKMGYYSKSHKDAIQNLVNEKVKPDMSEDELLKVKSDNPYVHSAILNHPNLTTLGIHRYYTDNVAGSQHGFAPNVQQAILNNPKTGSAALSSFGTRYVNHDNDHEVERLLNHPKADGNVVEALINHGGLSRNAVEMISKHPKASIDHLREIAWRQDIPSERSKRIFHNIINHPAIKSRDDVHRIVDSFARIPEDNEMKEVDKKLKSFDNKPVDPMNPGGN